MDLAKVCRKIAKKIIKWVNDGEEIKQSPLIQEAKNKSAPWAGISELQDNPYVKIGAYTYGLTANTVIRATEEATVTVGKFCSIAPNVIILAHADHPLNLSSTYPFKTLFCNVRKEICDPMWPNQDAVTYGSVSIGNDVWIGQNVTVLSGVTVGNGAIIGAGSVIARNVPPYAIVVGNPAKIVRYRFSPELIESFEKIKWWDFPDDVIESLLPFFYSTPEEFIAEIERRKIVDPDTHR